MTHTVPDGYHVRGVSTLYSANGELQAQWVKSAKDREAQLDTLREAVEEIAEPFRGAAKKVKAPKHKDKDLLAVYPMGDPHIGMFSWHRETGKNFDLEIAERNLVEAVDQLVSLAPPAEQALIINLGDFFHSDDQSNRTRRSGNQLDVDGRWAKVLGVGIRAMRRCIDQALRKHQTVRVVCEIGNHDDHTAIMLAICLAQYYEREPRVIVDTSPDTFHWLRFGKCLIGINHGDKVKPERLPGIMAVDRKEDWGETEYRYFYVGHIHHDVVKEYPGCIVETFRTLAPRDAWHHHAGYRAGQDMKLDILHRDFGKIQRHIIGINQICG